MVVFCLKAAAVLFLLSSFGSCASTQLKSRSWKTSAALAKQYYEEGAYGLAAEAYEQAAQKKPIKEILYNLSLARLANGELEKAIEILQGLQEGQAGSRIQQALAYAYYQSGRYDEAVRLYDSLLAENPALPPAHYYKAAIWQKQGKTDQALKAYEDLYGWQPEGYLAKTIAEIYYNRNNLDQAIAWLSEAVKSNLRQSGDFFLLAAWQIQAKQHKAAAESYTGGLSEREIPEYRFKLARLQLAFLGQSEAGLENLKKAVNGGYNNQTAFNELLALPALTMRREVRLLLTNPPND